MNESIDNQKNINPTFDNLDRDGRDGGVVIPVVDRSPGGAVHGDRSCGQKSPEKSWWTAQAQKWTLHIQWVTRATTLYPPSYLF